MTETLTQESGNASKGLKAGALGLVATTVIAVASTAPGYSLAAGIGGINEAVGVKAPFVMLFAFIPMGCIAAAFFYMNKADADCGTTFTWATRAFGPKTGWIGSWGLIIADLLIMPNLAGVSGQYVLLLFGADKAAENAVYVTLLGCAFILAMCWICWKGIELSARTQVALLSTELLVLAIFAVVAIYRAFGDGVTRTIDGVTYQSVTPSLSWLTPSGLSLSAIAAGLVVAVFAYWGWDTAVSVNEECEDSNRTPGIAAVLSVFILLAIYILTSFGTQAFLGPQFVIDNQGDAVYAVGKQALGGTFNKLLIIAILTSAAASCQTTILPATRSMLSMGSHKAGPGIMARIDPRTLTPKWSTWAFGIFSCLWFVALALVSGSGMITADYNIYWSSIAAVGLAIAFYYGITGFACVWYYRQYLLKSAKSFFLVGVLPLVGAVILTFVFVKTLIDSWKEDYGYGLTAGIGTVFFVGTVLLALGIPLMLICSKKYPGFFSLKPDAQNVIPDPRGTDGPAPELGS